MTHDSTTLAHLTAREGDATLLGTIAGAAYHEICYVLKTEADGSHQIVGRASDWPLIQLRAKNAELEALLTAETAHAAQAEQHVAELLARLEATPAIPIAMAAAATGLPIAPAQLLCPECGKAFGSRQAIGSHRHRAHGTRKKVTKERAAPLPPILLADNPAWRCAACHQTTFASSLHNPDYCQRCAKDLLASTNGHAFEVGGSA